MEDQNPQGVGEGEGLVNDPSQLAGGVAPEEAQPEPVGEPDVPDGNEEKLTKDEARTQGTDAQSDAVQE